MTYGNGSYTCDNCGAVVAAGNGLGAAGWLALAQHIRQEGGYCLPDKLGDYCGTRCALLALVTRWRDEQNQKA